MLKKLSLLVLSISSSCCASSPPVRIEYQYNDHIKAINIGDSNQVYTACYREGGKSDNGVKYGPNAVFCGCYVRDEKEIWINTWCNEEETLRHELCHAYNELSVKDCGLKYKVHWK